MALGKSFSLCDTDWTVNDVVAERKIPMQITTSLAEMPLGFQIRVDKQYCGGHNLPRQGGIGLIELPNSRWAKAHPAHLLAASLHKAKLF